MNSEVFITRKENWYDSAGEDLLLEEWITYVQSNEDMYLAYYHDLQVVNSPTGLDCEAASFWLGHPAEEKIFPLFYFVGGNIAVCNPDNYTVMQVHRVASALKGTVQGESCESFLNHSFSKNEAVKDLEDLEELANKALKTIGLLGTWD